MSYCCQVLNEYGGGLVTKSCPTLAPRLLSQGILQARIMEWVAISFSRGSPNPGIELGSPALQADSLPTELRGKANTKIKDIVTISE